MAWFVLVLAGICEIVWAIGLKTSAGLTRPVATVVTIIVMILSFVLLSRAMRSIPLGTAYGVWTGIGAVGAAAYGMWKLGEPRDWPRVLCIALIVLGIIGLKLLSTGRA